MSKVFTFQILSGGNFTDLEGSESQGWRKCETRYKALYGGILYLKTI